MRNKIAITVPHLSSFGGGEIFCEYVSNVLIKFYEIDLFFYKTEPINSNLKMNPKINLIPVYTSNRFLNYLCRNFIGFAQLYLIYFFEKKKIKYKFIFSAAGEFFNNYNKVYQYIHHPFYSLNLIHYFALGIKIHQIHLIVLRFLMSFISRLFFIFCNFNIYNSVTIVNSKWTKKRYSEIYLSKKIYIIYPTFRVPLFLNQKISFFENRKNDFVILGRVSSDKNTFAGIDFFLDLKKKNDCIGKLHIIGPNNKNYEIQKKIKFYKKKFRHSLLFHDYISLNKRNFILKSIKYGLHFSYNEHFGRSILEMHKLGLIVFAHDSGGSNEILVSNMQKYKSFKELQLKILKVLYNKDERFMILKKYKHKFEKKFSEKEFKKKIINILK